MRPRNHLIAITACAAAASAVHAGLIVENHSFEIAGPNGPMTTYTGHRGGGPSAAMGWGVFNNTTGTTTTELVPSDGVLPGAGDLMMHVTTTGHANGVGHVMLPFDTGPKCARGGIWVYVVSGTVLVGVGNGGNTGGVAYSTTTGQWEYLEGINFQCPANNYIVYSFAGAAEWYMDLASIEEATCPVDFNNDGAVDTDDLLFLLAQWGDYETCARADLNDDGVTDVGDLLILLAEWNAE